MKRIFSIVTAIALMLAFATAASAQIKVSESDTHKLFITLNTVGTLQALDQESAFSKEGKDLGVLEPGFQTAFGDLGFVGKFGANEELSVVFDLYLSSRNHPSSTYGNEGYLLVRGIPENLKTLKGLDKVFDKIDLKVGHFQLNYGDHLLHRSNNAIVQNNPLVGNFVIDPELVSIGGEIYTKPGRFNAMVGVSNGTNTEDFQEGRGIGYHAKVWAYPVKALRTSASFFRVDHGDNGPRSAGGSGATLFAGNRGGERYGAILGGGQAPGQVLPAGGKDVTAYQFDVTFDSALPIKLYANYGVTEDADINGSAAGSPVERWNYYAADAVYEITENLYAAARYSVAQADMLGGVASNGNVDRIQVGGGFWITKNMLLKLEYVEQKYRDFAAGDIVSGVQAEKDPSFSGPVAEVSFSF